MVKKLFAKLHLWLSVPFGVIITLLCLTGAILVFESEIKEWTSPSLYKASARSGLHLPFPELIRRVKSQLPDTVGISSIQVPSSPGKNYRLGVEGQRRTSLLVDPFTGEVKGISRPYAKGEFFSFVRRFHRWFLLQAQGPGISWGRMVTGTTTLVFVVIIISGMVVWIPRSWKGVKRRLSIERGRGRFRFWYDFHLSLGKLSALILLVMTLTGLTWSFDWYRKGFYKVFGVETSPTPTRQQRAGGEGQESRDRRQAAGTDKYEAWEKALAAVSGMYPGAVSLSVQDGAVSVTLSNRGNTRASDMYSFDKRSGEITGVEYYKDLPRSAKIRGWIYAVHVGSWGGMFTRVLYFIACLIGAALPVTGYYIWLKKRCKKWRRARKA